MRTLHIGHATPVRYRDPAFDEIVRGLRRHAAVMQPVLMGFWGLPPPMLAKAAREMAAGMGRPLVRVDLASVVSRYIGETEKNLERMFRQAEASGAVLLFDEADALFGRRTEVQDAHDRYAKLDIDVLLAHMERHRGLIVLATTGPLVAEPLKRRFRYLPVKFPPD